jgi:hypothetical protein
MATTFGKIEAAAQTNKKASGPNPSFTQMDAIKAKPTSN